MTTSKTPDERIKTVVFEEQSLVIGLMDGRRISTPLAWYPRLASATATQLGEWEIVGAGDALHWALFDEDLSVEGMLRGLAASDKRPGEEGTD